MLIDFIAYAGDCRVTGMFDLADGERLSDVLNDAAAITLRNARLTSHADGHEVELESVEIDIDDLFAVEVVGSRGHQEQRIHTVRHRLELRLGPYSVLGQLHTLPGGRPLVAIAGRAPMVPLTNATLAFNAGDGLNVRDVETLVVNRHLAEWVRADSSELPAFPGVPVAPVPAAG
jgi:hypothetical protein